MITSVALCTLLQYCSPYILRSSSCSMIRNLVLVMASMVLELSPWSDTMALWGTWVGKVMHGVSGVILETEEMTQTRLPLSVQEWASMWPSWEEPAITCFGVGWIRESSSMGKGKASKFVGGERVPLPPESLGICAWDRRTFRSECSWSPESGPFCYLHPYSSPDPFRPSIGKVWLLTAFVGVIEGSLVGVEVVNFGRGKLWYVVLASRSTYTHQERYNPMFVSAFGFFICASYSNAPHQ